MNDPVPSEQKPTDNDASVGQWILAVVACIAFAFYLFASDEASHEMLACSDDRLKETVTTIIEDEFGLEVLKLQMTSFMFPDVDIGTKLKDAYERESCIALLYSNQGRFGLKVVAWQDQPDEQVFVEVSEASLHAAVEAINTYKPE